MKYYTENFNTVNESKKITHISACLLQLFIFSHSQAHLKAIFSTHLETLLHDNGLISPNLVSQLKRCQSTEFGKKNLSLNFINNITVKLSLILSTGHQKMSSIWKVPVVNKCLLILSCPIKSLVQMLMNLTQESPTAICKFKYQHLNKRTVDS